MKFIRFTAGQETEIRTGVLENNSVREISGDMFGDWEYTGTNFPGDEVTLKAPLEPNQVIGIGANFVASKDDLPDELPEIPVFFYKPVSSVIGPETPIEIPAALEEVKFESELAVVIGKEAKNVDEKDVEDYIFGYTVGNDVTAPQYFHKDGHWTVGKSFDTFTPLGPVIETELDPAEVKVESSLNGEKKQDSHVSLMIVPMANMVSYLSKVMTLKPGDVILTGSPLGAEFLKDGDRIECTIEGIGTLANNTQKAKDKVSV
ncbi:fumarylacetoacetate hydrolase family protein [Bacillus marinisedimentorum]|uniref:fumarylacetoacetate hydrolase family protein n=1 Tax=Bacillus marinisedimentorum TaxID=1821260 RepID=UPI000872CF45|nr:fumarylacetoacetate hydrolase family protein [Bacillus marinisedimentorum]